MNIYEIGPVSAILHAAYVGVTALADALEPLAGGLSAALAIVVLTLIVRSALIPVGISQVRAEYTRRRIAPKLQALQKRYKKNPELLAKKTTELYAAEKASPFAGMLPALAQAPVLGIVYGLFIQQTISGEPNALLGHDILGASLGRSLFTTGWPGVVVYAVLLAAIAAVALLSRRANQRFALPATTPSMQTMNNVLSWMPLITVVFAAFVPLAATLYLAVTTTWTFVERSILRARLNPERPDAATGAALAS
jgi:YidC/Oxa1 family membrane protein insertase